MTTGHSQAEIAELHVRIHALEQDAKDRELVILHLKARCLALMEQLREHGVPAIPVEQGLTAHHRPKSKG